MQKVRSRTDDMLIIRGVNVFPSQIEDVLFQIEGVRPHYLIVVDRKKNLDDLEVRIEVEEAVFSDIMADMVAFQRDGLRQAAVGARSAREDHARRAGCDRAQRGQEQASARSARDLAASVIRRLERTTGARLGLGRDSGRCRLLLVAAGAALGIFGWRCLRAHGAAAAAVRAEAVEALASGADRDSSSACRNRFR